MCTTLPQARAETRRRLLYIEYPEGILEHSAVLYVVAGINRSAQLRAYGPGALLLSCASEEVAETLRRALHGQPLMAGTPPLAALAGPAGMNRYQSQTRNWASWEEGSQEELNRRLGDMRTTAPSKFFRREPKVPPLIDLRDSPRGGATGGPDIAQPAVRRLPSCLTPAETAVLDQEFQALLQGPLLAQEHPEDGELIAWGPNDPLGTSTPTTEGLTEEEIRDLDREDQRRREVPGECPWCAGKYPPAEGQQHREVCAEIFTSATRFEGEKTDLCPRCGGQFPWAACKKHQTICRREPTEPLPFANIPAARWHDLTRCRQCLVCQGRIPRCTWEEHRAWCLSTREDATKEEDKEVCLQCRGQYPPAWIQHHMGMCERAYERMELWRQRRDRFGRGPQ